MKAVVLGGPHMDSGLARKSAWPIFLRPGMIVEGQLVTQ
jgi:hypothetical protein